MILSYIFSVSLLIFTASAVVTSSTNFALHKFFCSSSYTSSFVFFVMVLCASGLKVMQVSFDVRMNRRRPNNVPCDLVISKSCGDGDFKPFLD